jgi:hypothetical protein
VQNYNAIETEVTHRRREWERKLVTATQVAQSPSQNGRKRWSLLPHLVFASLRAVAAPRLPLMSSWNTTAELPKPLREVAPM